MLTVSFALFLVVWMVTDPPGAPPDEPNHYLKAVAELDTRLILAKVFSPDDTDMRHTLVATRYRRQVDEADTLQEDDALDLVLLAYAPPAVYVVPRMLAKHLKLAEDRLIAALERLRARELMRLDSVTGHKGDVYVWTGGSIGSKS